MRLSGLPAEEAITRSKSLVLGDAASQVKGAVRKVLGMGTVLETTGVAVINAADEITPADKDSTQCGLSPSGSSSFSGTSSHPTSVAEV